MSATESVKMVEGDTDTQDAVVDSHTTSFHPVEVGLSDTNLPNILFMLEPPPTWGATAVQAALDNDGSVMIDKDGNEIREFDFLPARISIRPEAWRLLLYTDRSHPLCGARDLHTRMWPGEGETLLQPNAMNMQKTRLRNALNIPCWVRNRSEPSMGECLMYEQYSYASVCLNTMLHVGETGLLKPVMPGSIAEVAPEILPLTEFLHGEGSHEPSARLKKIFRTIADLQDIAFQKGYAHWIFLENKHKPQSWISKAKSQHHPLTRPNDIRVPRTETMPSAAVAWIESCVRDVIGNNGTGFLPASEALPEHAMRWKQQIIYGAFQELSSAMHTMLEEAGGKQNVLSEVQDDQEMNSSDEDGMYEDKDLEGSSAQDGLRISGTSQLAASPTHGNGNDHQLRNTGDTGILGGQALDIETEDLDDIEVPDDFDYEAYEAELDAMIAARRIVVPDVQN